MCILDKQWLFFLVLGKESTGHFRMWVQSLGWEDPLEEGMATYSSILAWRIPMDRGTSWTTVHGVPKIQIQLNMAQHKNTACTCQIQLGILSFYVLTLASLLMEEWGLCVALRKGLVCESPAYQETGWRHPGNWFGTHVSDTEKVQNGWNFLTGEC